MERNIITAAIERLKPNTWNPNVLPEGEYAHLRESIRITKGEYLEQNPILVRKVGDNYEIIDGEHRWKVCKELQMETIPVAIKDISTEQAQIMTVILNKNRGQLSYFKFSKLINKLYNGGECHTQEELAKKFGYSRSLIADILFIYPRLKNCLQADNFKNSLLLELARVRDDSLRKKLIEKTLERNWKRNTVRTQATKFNAIEDYVSSLTPEENLKGNLIAKLDENILFNFDLKALKNEIDILFQGEQKKRIIHGDALDEMERMEVQFDCIIADPPFGLSTVSSGRKFSFTTRKAIDQSKGEWDEFSRAEYLDFTKEWIRKVKGVLKEGGAIFIFAADVFLSHIIQILRETGFEHRISVCWHKTNPAPQIMKNNLISSVEYIIYATKGNPKTFNWLGERTMHNFIAAPIPAKKYDHPTQKPVKVIEKVLKIATNVGDLVLDPFGGTGSTAVACKNLNRGWVVIEKDEKWIRTIEARTK